MKKTVSIILIVGIIITMFSGCSNKIVGKEFSSEEEMINYLEGTWVNYSSPTSAIWSFKGNGYASKFYTLFDKVYSSESEYCEYNYENGTFSSYNNSKPEIVIKESGAFEINNNDPEDLSKLYKLSDSASLGKNIADTYDKILEKKEDYTRLFQGPHLKYGGADDYGVSFALESHAAFITSTDVTLIVARTEDFSTFYNHLKDLKKGENIGPNLLAMVGKNTGEKIDDKSVYELVYYLYITDNGEILTNVN